MDNDEDITVTAVDDAVNVIAVDDFHESYCTNAADDAITSVEIIIRMAWMRMLVIRTMMMMLMLWLILMKLK